MGSNRYRLKADEEALLLNYRKHKDKGNAYYEEEKNYNKSGIHIVSGCHHVPAHNKKLFNGLLSLCEDLQNEIVGFHLIGDFLDMGSISRHSSGMQSKTTLTKEYKEGNKALNAIDQVLNEEVDKTYIWGNHEDWYNQHLSKIDNAKLGRGVIKSPTEALRLKERKYDVYEDWKEDKVTIGKHLELIHGIYCNVHAAKKHIDVFRNSVMFAHTHRVQTFIEGNVAGFNIGTMCDINNKAFSYASRAMKSKWNNGFAIVHIDNNGRYYVTQILAFNDAFYYNGKKYGG
tara:strand:- start:384 stop:1244 length:861 start_codon:yes stop_codon:yes gene_type:complete